MTSSIVDETQMRGPGVYRRFAALLVTLVLGSSLGGCVLALGGQRHVSGAELPPRLEPLEKDLTEQQLIGFYGLPSERRELSATEIALQWTEVLRPRACRTYLLGLIPLGRDLRLTRRIVARLDHGRLVSASVSYLDRKGTLTFTEPLLDAPTGTPPV